MHNQMMPGEPEVKRKREVSISSEASEASLYPLLRLRQLAEEIRGAANRNDLAVVCQAANLLAPTLARCLEARDQRADSAGEAAQLALQTRSVLLDCETTLTQTLRGIAAEMRRLQQGKRAISLARRQGQTGTESRNLNAAK
jgi:hypothetical protein